LEKEAGEKAFLAIVTLESRILDMMTPDQPSAAERVIESVQTMLFIDGHLNDRAFVQAVISAVEAKSKVWHEHAQLVSNRKASTRKHTRKYSPDGLLIATTQRGNPVTGAEGTAVLGIEIDQIITEATDVAVRQFLGLEKETLV
jgi:iron complex transport system ATP-binding protein